MMLRRGIFLGLALLGLAGPSHAVRADVLPLLRLTKPADVLQVQITDGSWSQVATANTPWFPEAVTQWGPGAYTTPYDLFTTQATNVVAISPKSASINFYSPAAPTLPINSVFAQIFGTTEAQHGVLAQEYNVFLEMVNENAEIHSWLAATAYGALAYTHDAGASQTYQNVAGACTSGAGPGPSGTGSGQVDGTCVWDYVTLGINDGKTVIGNSQVMRNGAGHGWLQASPMTIMPGAFTTPGGFAVLHEMDIANLNVACPPAVPGGCQIYGLWLNGIPSAGKPATVGIFGGGAAAGSEFYSWGLALLSYFAKDIGILESSFATIGTVMQSGGTQQYGLEFRGASTISTTHGTGTPTFDWLTDESTAGRSLIYAAGAYGGSGGAGILDVASHTGASTVALRLKGVDAIEFDGVYHTAAGTPLPACNATTSGQFRVVSDAAAFAYNGPYVGGGAPGALALVMCIPAGGGWFYR